MVLQRRIALMSAFLEITPCQHLSKHQKFRLQPFDTEGPHRAETSSRPCRQRALVFAPSSGSKSSPPSYARWITGWYWMELLNSATHPGRCILEDELGVDLDGAGWNKLSCP